MSFSKGDLVRRSAPSGAALPWHQFNHIYIVSDVGVNQETGEQYLTVEFAERHLDIYFDKKELVSLLRLIGPYDTKTPASTIQRCYDALDNSTVSCGINIDFTQEEIESLYLDLTGRIPGQLVPTRDKLDRARRVFTEQQTFPARMFFLVGSLFSTDCALNDQIPPTKTWREDDKFVDWLEKQFKYYTMLSGFMQSVREQNHEEWLSERYELWKKGSGNVTGTASVKFVDGTSNNVGNWTTIETAGLTVLNTNQNWTIDSTSIIPAPRPDCSECGGSGIYTGLEVREPCSLCGSNE